MSHEFIIKFSVYIVQPTFLCTDIDKYGGFILIINLKIKTQTKAETQNLLSHKQKQSKDNLEVFSKYLLESSVIARPVFR